MKNAVASLFIFIYLMVSFISCGQSSKETSTLSLKLAVTDTNWRSGGLVIIGKNFSTGDSFVYSIGLSSSTFNQQIPKGEWELMAISWDKIGLSTGVDPSSLSNLSGKTICDKQFLNLEKDEQISLSLSSDKCSNDGFGQREPSQLDEFLKMKIRFSCNGADCDSSSGSLKYYKVVAKNYAFFEGKLTQISGGVESHCFPFATAGVNYTELAVNLPFALLENYQIPFNRLRVYSDGAQCEADSFTSNASIPRENFVLGSEVTNPLESSSFISFEVDTKVP